jgi:hypothetical protein
MWADGVGAGLPKTPYRPSHQPTLIRDPGVPIIATHIENPFGAASAHRGACPSIMLLALLSLCCGMILDTVSRGRKQMKRIDYVVDQPPTGTHSSGVSRIGPDDRCSLRASPAPPTSTRCVRRYPKPMTASRSPVLRRDPRNGGGGPRRHHRGSGRQKGGARR